MRARPLVALALPVLALAALGARTPDDPKYEHHFHTVGPVPGNDVVGLELVDAHSQVELVQAQVKVTNKSSDKLVVIKKEEAAFVLPDGTEMKTRATGLPFMGPLLIPPNETKGYTFKIAADSGLNVDKVTLKPGGIYVGSNTGAAVKAPDFALPPSANDFTAGPFSCSLKERKQETKETAVQFVCRYDGKGIGIVEPKRLGVKANGQEFANEAGKMNRDVLFPGDSTKVNAVFHVPAKVADMQFAQMQVLWRDALSESPLEPAKLGDWNFELDPELTKKANE